MQTRTEINRNFTQWDPGREHHISDHEWIKIARCTKDNWYTLGIVRV